MTTTAPETYWSQDIYTPKGVRKFTPWFSDFRELAEYIEQTGGTINATYKRCGGEMWEIVAGEELRV